MVTLSLVFLGHSYHVFKLLYFIYNKDLQSKEKHVMAHTELETTPKREKLSILVTADENEEFDLESLPRVNPFQLLNVIHGETHVQKSLMYVHAIVNGV